eukprot:2366356-Amphidinium_carterae.1
MVSTDDEGKGPSSDPFAEAGQEAHVHQPDKTSPLLTPETSGGRTQDCSSNNTRTLLLPKALGNPSSRLNLEPNWPND